jgi:hypothetical protein
VIAGQLLLVGCAALLGQAADRCGTIGGEVLNASAGRSRIAHAPVVLRIEAEGQYAPFQETTTDGAGRFLFQHLPVGTAYHYLPGANRDGVHYPGPAVRLTPQRPRAMVELTVCDAVAAPSPLVIRRQTVRIHADPDAISVTESMLIDNPSATCYVGQAWKEGGEPVTLQVAIPTDFGGVTFHEEFFGRRFVVADGKLVTGIPWTPGKREMTFAYVLPNTQPERVWRRGIDLPCEEIRVEVSTARPDEVSCSLPRQKADGGGLAVFQSTGPALPPGQVIQVQLGRLPIAWVQRARWWSPLALIGLVALAGFWILCLGRNTAGKQVTPVPRRYNQR